MNNNKDKKMPNKIHLSNTHTHANNDKYATTCIA